MKKTSVVITGLNNNYNKKVARLLCEKLAMFLLDVADLMEFELAEKDEMIAKCGIDYFKQQEKKMFSSLSQYENTVIVTNYDHFVFDNHFELFPNAYIFYLRFPKDKLTSKDGGIISLLAFEERDETLKRHCITIPVCGKEHEVAKQVIGALKEVAL